MTSLFKYGVWSYLKEHNITNFQHTVRLVMAERGSSLFLHIYALLRFENEEVFRTQA